MELPYEMYQMSAESFASIAEPAMQPFWDGYKKGLYDRFHGGQDLSAEMPGGQLYAEGYRAGLEGIPAVCLIQRLLEEEYP